MKLHYFLYFVIGSVASNLTESGETSEGTLQKHPKLYGSSYREANVYHRGRNTFQSISEVLDNITSGIPVIPKITQNITEKINRFHKTEEKIFPLAILPLFFVPDPAHKFQETTNVYPNHNVQNYTQNYVNYEAQELPKMYPNHDVQESYTGHQHDVQDHLHINSTPDLRRVIQLGLIHRPQRAAEKNFVQPLLKVVQLNVANYNLNPVQSHTQPNYYNFIKLDPTYDHRDLMQSDIKHSQEGNHNNRIKSREIINFQKPGVRVLGVPRIKNLTDSPRDILRLNTSSNPNKRNTLSNVKKHDSKQLDQNVKKPIAHDQKDDFKTPNEADETRDIRKFRARRSLNSVQFFPVHSMKNLTEVMQPSDQRKKSKDFPTHILTKTVNQDYILPKPVQLDPSHNMRKPVQLNPMHFIREPVKLHSTHNLQKPVQLDRTHEMRRPVDLQSSHDLRRPVKLESTNNLRKPVKLMESHDLRWPVVEESNHNMRNPMTDADIFRIRKADWKLNEFIKLQVHKVSNTSFIDDPLHEFLYEDEFLLLKCSRGEVNFNRTLFSIGTNSGNAAIRSVTTYKKLFNESIKACGVPFNHSTDNLRKETKLTKWPWMVSLHQYIFNRFWHKCAGSLLNNLWVITAAHCVESRPKWDFLLQLGMNEDSRNHVERFIDRMSIHPKFNSLSLDHDIALLRMDAPVAFQTGIVPICLPWKPDDIDRKKAVALTWRLAKEKNVSDLSREKTVPVLTNKECEVVFSETGSSESIQKSFICASFEKRDQDSCAGDSGGPLVIFDDSNRWILAGIYSWGKSCRTQNQPEVYIRISRYAEWIEETILCYEENINLRRMD